MRGCPLAKERGSAWGAGFAQQEAVLILAHILRHFRLSVPDGFEPEVVSRLTLRPKSGMLLVFTPR